MGGRLVFDLETDGLLLDCTKCHIVAAYDLNTGKMQYWLEGDLSWKEVFSEADLLVGHNILGFDIFVLEKLFEWKPSKHTKVQDTLILSRVLDYYRFGREGHALEIWGRHFDYPKGDFDDWSQYTKEMLEYCLQDVRLTVKVYRQLVEEYKKAYAKKDLIKPYLQAEHAVAKWCSMAQLYGWPFDIERAKILHAEMKVEMDFALDALEKKLGTKCVAIDKKLGEVEWKVPKWIKNGNYNAHTANWFGIDPETGQDEDRLVEAEYSRVVFEPLLLTSVADVKIFLFRNGWEPTEYNSKFDEETKQKIQTSPKITEDSLEFLGGDGKLYCDFLTTSSRYNNLTTWIKNTDENGRLHGDCFSIGTPSMRARHSIIVNVPSGEVKNDGTPVSPWGPEMRELFGVLPGWSFIGADSTGNQARGLAHYLNNENFIKLLLEGDIHQYNADTLTMVLDTMGIKHTVPRSVAKRILYAFLFGASGKKLWGYIFGKQEQKNGNKLKEGFLKAVPGFKSLMEKLEKVYSSTKKFSEGYIYSIAGVRIYVDSFHKLLVYLLQSLEKATCSAACLLLMEGLEKENIPYQPLIFMHDELDFMVPDEYKERAAQIAKDAFRNGPKLFGVMIMDGDAKIGKNWHECH